MPHAVIHRAHGGFELPPRLLAAVNAGRARRGERTLRSDEHVPRNDPVLVSSVTKSAHEDLVAVPTKAGARYVVYEHDGLEWLAEDHRVYDHVRGRWVRAGSLVGRRRVGDTSPIAAFVA